MIFLPMPNMGNCYECEQILTSDCAQVKREVAHNLAVAAGIEEYLN